VPAQIEARAGPTASGDAMGEEEQEVVDIDEEADVNFAREAPELKPWSSIIDLKRRLKELGAAIYGDKAVCTRVG
jgi:hypothetical protein